MILKNLYQKNNKKLNKVVDDNSNLSKYKITEHKVIPFYKIYKKDLQNSINFICHHNLSVFYRIKKRLVKIGGRKIKVFHFNGP